jgi:hypothetical protein
MSHEYFDPVLHVCSVPKRRCSALYDSWGTFVMHVLLQNILSYVLFPTLLPSKSEFLDRGPTSVENLTSWDVRFRRGYFAYMKTYSFKEKNNLYQIFCASKKRTASRPKVNLTPELPVSTVEQPLSRGGTRQRFPSVVVITLLIYCSGHFIYSL